MRSLALLLALVSGCYERTEIIVGVATDLRAKGQIDLVQFVASRSGTPIIEHTWPLADLPADRYELPGSFGLYSPDGSEPSVELSVRGFLGNALVSERRSIIRLVSGKTLFMRLGLVAGCSEINGPGCASNESCIEGVCRPLNENAHRFPNYRPELVGATACNSGTHFIVSSSGDVMPSLGDSCAANEYCQEGLCYKILPDEDGGVGQGLWTEQSAPTTYVLRALWGTADGQHVFAVGEGGTILHLQGGPIMAASSWLEETLERGYTLNGIWGTGPDDVYAVGSGGVILHRSAAGWAHESGPTVEKLDAVYGAGGEVWAVGRDQGKAVALVRDGAGSWMRSAGTSGGPLRALWTGAPSDVWAVGFGFNLQHYDGMVWSALPTEMPTDLFGVFGGGDGSVWMGGPRGLVARAAAGSAPTLEPSGITSDLFAVWAGGPDDLYVAGDYGIILHRSGGEWVRQPSGTLQPLFALWGSGPNDIYAAGRDGVVLHSTGIVIGPADDLAIGDPEDMAVALTDLSEPDLTPVQIVNLGHVNIDSGYFEDFVPDPITIAVGTTVIWRWPANDLGTMNIHSVASCIGDAGVGAGIGCFGGSGPTADGRWCSHAATPDITSCNSITPSPGPFEYQHKFDQPGTYDYFCKQHAGFYGINQEGLGEIIVK